MSNFPEPVSHLDAVSTRRSPLAAVLLVEAVYVFFLIFAQFGFLQGVQDLGLGASTVRPILGVMALAGFTASLRAPRLIQIFGERIAMTAGLACCAISGAAAGHLFAHSQPIVGALIAVAALAGGGLGLTTVGLASALRSLTGGRSIGVCVGIGTGLAYLVCNIPGLFNAAPEIKSLVGAAFAAGGCVLALLSPNRSGDTLCVVEYRYASLASRGALGAITVIFFALIWFDSAAFSHIQATPRLAAAFADDDRARWIIGGVHAVAALAAGVVMDLGFPRTLLGVALTLLIGGNAVLTSSEPAMIFGAPLYVAGVSVYSTALASFSALTPPGAHRLSAAARAAWIYAFAGWIGSTLGVALSEQAQSLPAWAPVVAVVVGGGALLNSRRPSRGPHPS